MSDKTTSVAVTRVASHAPEHDDDVVVIEEPLEISAAWGDREKNISVTMRTPGDDFDLAVGFLFTEGLIRGGDDVESVRHWGSPNRVRVALGAHARIDTTKLERHFFTTSSCGICGKTSIDALRTVVAPIPPHDPIARDVVTRLPDLLQNAQPAFHATGSVHGAALFDFDGALLRAREDRSEEHTSELQS